MSLTNSKVDTDLRRLRALAVVLPINKQDFIVEDEVLPSFSEFSRLLVKSVLCPVKIHHPGEKSNLDHQPYKTIRFHRASSILMIPNLIFFVLFPLLLFTK